MSNQNSDGESTIEISPYREEKPLSPKVLVGPIMAINVMALAITSAPKTPLQNLIDERIIIEQGKNTVLYPSIKLKYRNGYVVQDNEEIVNGIPSVKNNVRKGNKATADITFQQIIGDLRKENAVLKNRLKNSLPAHTLIYMIGSSIIAAVALTLLIIRFALNIYIIDPYYLVCALIVSLGLFFTAFVSLKGWKDNLLDERIR